MAVSHQEHALTINQGRTAQPQSRPAHGPGSKTGVGQWGLRDHAAGQKVEKTEAGDRETTVANGIYVILPFQANHALRMAKGAPLLYAPCMICRKYDCLVLSFRRMRRARH